MLASHFFIVATEMNAQSRARECLRGMVESIRLEVRAVGARCR